MEMKKSCQFNSKNLEKSTQKIKSGSSNLALLKLLKNRQLLKNNRTLRIDTMTPKEIYEMKLKSNEIYKKIIIISSKVNIQTFQICFEKRFALYYSHTSVLSESYYNFLLKIITV